MPNQKLFNQLLIFVNLYQHAKNEALSSIFSGEKLLKNPAFWLAESILSYICFFYKQWFFSTQPQCYLIQLQMLLRSCSLYITIILLRHILCLLHLCPCLDLVLFMLYLCDITGFKLAVWNLQFAKPFGSLWMSFCIFF